MGQARRGCDPRVEVGVIAKDDGGPGVAEQSRLGSGVLDHRAVRREIAAKHRHAAFVIERSTVDFAQAAFALLSAGGALGFLGYWRAHGGALRPHGHNVTATLTCLAAGIVAALVVAGYTVAGALSGWIETWSDGPWVILPALFATANLVWALSGIAWMQRLARRYAEKTGRTFDTLPVMFLFVSLALAIAAALMTTTL